MKYKVGDKVRAIRGTDDWKRIIGQVGVIKAIHDERYCVEFQKDIGGHRCNMDTITLGHGWNCDEEDLVLVNDTIRNLRNKVLGIKEEVKK